VVTANINTNNTIHYNIINIITILYAFDCEIQNDVTMATIHYRKQGYKLLDSVSKLFKR
jgi:hypothetical protein